MLRYLRAAVLAAADALNAGQHLVNLANRYRKR
jgi:hypothetical protein